jgi:murein DD-endopeptidase MepM/ murein hydrolase activator NlpD
LAVVAAGAWYLAVTEFRQNRAEIIIQVAEWGEALALPYRILQLQQQAPDEELLIPIAGVAPRDVANTYGDLRSGNRRHEGIDIFAEGGTPVYAVAAGYVLRVGESGLGGNYVFTIGAGGRRYYYAHLAATAEGLGAGDRVSVDTVLGFVGNTGNASTTPPHLHLGLYHRGPLNPYELLVARPSRFNAE